MKKEMKIPMSLPSFSEKELELVISTMKNGWVSEGSITKKFENKLEKYFSSKVSIVNNGSSALMCSLLAHGIKPGDKIVVPAFTFIATSSIPKLLGAKIIVADINPDTLNIDLKKLETILKKQKVKAVIAVDVAGLAVDLDQIKKLSKKYNFILIEDAAEALGSEYKRKKLGSFNHTSIFSFHIAKQISTIEGGCIATKNISINNKIKMIKNHGRVDNGEYEHEIIGGNFRTTDIQSSIGIIQLAKIKKHLDTRNKIASFYKKNLSEFEFQKIPKFATKHSYMLFFLITENKTKRDRILKKLISRGVDARKAWKPINLQNCNVELKKYSCPNAKKIFETGITLPIYNTMTLDDARYVIESI